MEYDYLSDIYLQFHDLLTMTGLCSPQEENDRIERAYQEILQAYLSSQHRKKVELIERAYRFACQAHKGVRRRNGVPYIMHPLAVAKIVICELGLGSTSICAALLHDVMDDTDYTPEDISAAFGPKIASIVEGLAKISGGIFGDNARLQAENFRKLLLSMSTDVRVVLIKMADRLDNMRHLSAQRPEKQLKIAGETLYVYAPLAHRLGLYKMKEEFEDLSFRYEHPDKYAEIMSMVDSSATHRNAIVEQFVAPVRAKLDAAGFRYTVKARVKSAYSIWRKMMMKNVGFDDIYDVYAVRVVFENDNDAEEAIRCWQIYTFFTEDHRVHPDRLRDWITTPKANGYRALHITVMGPDGKWIEVQIRSAKMDRIAELGYAAHWKYKHGDYEEDSELTVWMNTIKDILANPEPNAIDFLDTIKLNLFASDIYVFTPKGDLITLPKGATVLDMAFAVHTQLGLHCIAAKIAHKLVPLSHLLESGDQVEIITSESQQPQADWLAYCHTPKAKQALRGVLRREPRTEAQHVDAPQERRQSSSSLLSKILRNPFSSRRRPGEAAPAEKIDRTRVFVLHPEASEPNYRVEDCCAPIPGDDVLGFIDDDEKVVLHKVDCPRASRLKSGYGDRLIATRWADSGHCGEMTIEIDAAASSELPEKIIHTVCTEQKLSLVRMEMDQTGDVAHILLRLRGGREASAALVCGRLRKISGVSFAVLINQC
ncbi:MAG: bifunctional (p)ppGpp synthetase/guanosine-3',5'-bis(diphosphate) 3'-pyrophosphohydrolase [Muribaculaceae bacterium]|nr:bifunctional (p)ppGpp synthetase/guanosine-3',5'-bis(diphosphate) 3'-pyrophosphohydrolase [Muribaculaceae bacterium]